MQAGISKYDNDNSRESGEGVSSRPFNIMRSIRVFISSKCGDKGRFDSMRETLAQRLDGTGAFHAYLWERGGASTRQAGERYLAELKDCDVVVFVIDNKVGVTPGVQNEIDYATLLGKRSLYYFCSEFESEPTSLQKQLSGANGSVYRVVDTMDNIPSYVFHDLQEDIFTRYREWCNHDIVSIGEQPSFDYSPGSVIRGTQLPKGIVSRLPGLQEVFRCFLFGEDIDGESCAGLDCEVARFAQSLFLDTNIEIFNFKNLVSEIQHTIPEPYAAVIEKRWEANCHYFKRDVAAAISTLEEVLEIARDGNLEEWLIDDILIDLRNVYSELSDYPVLDNPYQEQLSTINHEVSYPLLDRAVSDALQAIEKDRFKSKTQSFNSVTYGNNINGMLEPICRAFAIASYFGSLTNLSLIIQYLKALVFFLCSKNQDARLNGTLLKLSIITGRRGDGEKTLQSFNDTCFDSNSCLAKDIFDFCAKYRCLNESKTAVFEAFEMVGCYLNEADYVGASSVFVSRAEECLIKLDPWLPVPESVFKAQRSNSRRLSSTWMIDYATRAIKNGKNFWPQEALRFIAHTSLDYSLATEETITSLLDAIDAVVENTGQYDVQCCATDALSNLSEEFSSDWRSRIDLVAKKLPSDLARHYKDVAGGDPSDDGLADLISRSIQRIESHNETQGVGGAYSFGENEYARAASLMILMKSPSVEFKQRLYTACLGTLRSSTFDITGKTRACEAMCQLLCNYGIEILDPKACTVQALANKSLLLQGQTFRKENKMLLSVWIDALSILAGKDFDSDLCVSLGRCYRDEEYTQANAGEACLYMVQSTFIKLPSDLRGVIFSYGCYLAKSLHFQLNFRGLELLSSFLCDEDFQSAAAQILFDTYTGQSPRGKQIIIEGIASINSFNPELADELRAMVLRDNTTTAVAYLEEIESKE